MLAIVNAYKAGLLNYKQWASNAIAGLIVGIVALPLAMAFAIASGVKPEQGIYTAIVAAFIVAVFGGSRVQIAGPTGAFIVILASITAHYGIEGLQVASLLAGIILILMGIAKLGNVIKFIPYPVIVGFTAGIGFIIFFGEWKDFFGLPVAVPLDAHFTEKFAILMANFTQLNGATTGLGFLSLALVIFTPKILKRIPGPLVALVITTLIQAFFPHDGVATLGSTFGEIPSHLPSLHFPLINIDRILELIGPAFTIALLGAIESLLSASVADGMIGTRHHSNQELIGQGLANIASPLFGGFAATGAIARTATNIRNGGNSPLAAIVHSLVLLAILLLLAPLASAIPLCTLAAILFVVAYNMSDIPHFIEEIKHGAKLDIIVLLTTFLLTVFTNLVVAVNVGVILAMLFFIRNMAHAVTIEEIQDDKLQAELTANGIASIPKNMLVYTIQGPFFFGAAEKIEQLLTITHTEPKIIIFRLKHIPFIDMTGLQAFTKILYHLHAQGIKIYLCEANSTVNSKIKRFHLLKIVEQNKIFDSLTDAIKTHVNHEPL